MEVTKWLKPSDSVSRNTQVTKQQAALLAGIGQSITLSAGEPFAGEVQHCDPLPAVSSVRAGRTDKPGAAAAKVAIGPCDRDTLLDRFPIVSQQTARSIGQNDRILYRAHIDSAGRLSATKG